jgi:hypothetical protein|tara:strand:+ start:276 stop:584 length:309 start_codon:yes stop_codon:yes gene_type:complete
MNDHYDIKEVILVIGVAIAAIVIGSGCASRPSIDYEWESVPQQPLASGYKYYVVDTHSDIPDANFSTYEEAAIYQKEFAEYHEYVIVKMEGEYNVYNMEPIK